MTAARAVLVLEEPGDLRLVASGLRVDGRHDVADGVHLRAAFVLPHVDPLRFEPLAHGLFLEIDCDGLRAVRRLRCTLSPALQGELREGVQLGQVLLVGAAEVARRSREARAVLRELLLFDRSPGRREKLLAHGREDDLHLLGRGKAFVERRADGAGARREVFDAGPRGVREHREILQHAPGDLEVRELPDEGLEASCRVHEARVRVLRRSDDGEHALVHVLLRRDLPLRGHPRDGGAARAVFGLEPPRHEGARRPVDPSATGELTHAPHDGSIAAPDRADHVAAEVAGAGQDGASPGAPLALVPLHFADDLRVRFEPPARLADLRRRARPLGLLVLPHPAGLQLAHSLGVRLFEVTALLRVAHEGVHRLRLLALHLLGVPRRRGGGLLALAAELPVHAIGRLFEALEHPAQRGVSGGHDFDADHSLGHGLTSIRVGRSTGRWRSCAAPRSRGDLNDVMEEHRSLHVADEVEDRLRLGVQDGLRQAVQSSSVSKLANG
jgi:hypothetical protein